MPLLPLEPLQMLLLVFCSYAVVHVLTSDDVIVVVFLYTHTHKHTLFAHKHSHIQSLLWKCSGYFFDENLSITLFTQFLISYSFWCFTQLFLLITFISMLFVLFPLILLFCLYRFCIIFSLFRFSQLQHSTANDFQHDVTPRNFQ